MIRYHSFYPWHKENAYTHLMNEDDVAQLAAVRAFNRECTIHIKQSGSADFATSL